MHPKNIIQAGTPLADAKKALILIHGRGGDAKDILSIARHLEVSGFALLAPEAENKTWYPYSFMADPNRNEPWLNSALNILKGTVEDIIAQGISAEHIYLLGFSQGACLTLEFAARNPRRYGGVIAFTGGLIGDRIEVNNYKGDFKNSPVFIGTSDPDIHVPTERVRETSRILKTMHADVLEQIYPEMGHTITTEELRQANEHVFRRFL
jgi:phospholipase/carboxylesterase